MKLCEVCGKNNASRTIAQIPFCNKCYGDLQKIRIGDEELLERYADNSVYALSAATPAAALSHAPQLTLTFASDIIFKWNGGIFMNTDAFSKWLTDSQGMTVRSARDVISRCKRVNTITGQKEITELTIEILNGSDEFHNKSMFVKSQLRRAVALYLTFKPHEQKGD